MPLSRRNFIRIAGSGGVSAAAGAGVTQCDRMPETALAAWRGPGAAERDPRRRAIAWAILAPNPHNRQPWLVDLAEPGTITLYCDRTRLLPQTDPFGRQILIGHGAFLELLAMAAAAEGWRAEIAPFPEGGFDARRVGDAPVARVRLLRDAALRPDPLFAHVRARRSTKRPYDTGRPVAAEHLARFAAAGTRDGIATTATAEPRLRDSLRDMTRRAFAIETETPRTFGESVDLIRLGAGEIDWYRDGISLHGPMFWWGARLGLIDKRSLADRDSWAFKSGQNRYAAMFASAMAFAWMTTPDNRRETQLETGRAYLRLNLLATALGVAIHPVSQVLQEFKEMAALQAEFRRAIGAPEGRTVQMLVRLGHAAPPPPSPRRDPADLVLA